MSISFMFHILQENENSFNQIIKVLQLFFRREECENNVKVFKKNHLVVDKLKAENNK